MNLENMTYDELHELSQELEGLSKQIKRELNEVKQVMKEKGVPLRIKYDGWATKKQKTFATSLIGQSSNYELRRHYNTLSKFHCHCIISKLYHKSDNPEVNEGFLEAVYAFDYHFIGIIDELIRDKGYATRVELIELFGESTFEVFRKVARDSDYFPFEYIRISKEFAEKHDVPAKLVNRASYIISEE